MNRIWVRKFFILLIALVLCSGAVLAVGESPFNVFKILFMSAFGSAENFSYTLFYAAPLLLTGTSVALASEAGLFNIGAEGQLYIGALFAVTWGILAKFWLPGSVIFSSFLFLGAVFFSFLGGALWGGFTGFLKLRYRVHEVISSIMLNFIAMAVVNWSVLNPLKNPETQNVETLWIADTLQIPKLWLHSTLGLPFGLFLATAVLLAVKKTWLGFRIRAVGANVIAAKRAGISVERTSILTMIIAGGISGLVGFHEVYCNSYRLLDGFSPSYGFTGLAIALLARGNLLNLICAAFLFAALHKGALDLDIETEKITRDLSGVIQAIILIVLAARPVFLKGIRSS